MGKGIGIGKSLICIRVECMTSPIVQCLVSVYKGVARGSPGVPVIPIGRPSFEQTTYNIQVAKTS